MSLISKPPWSFGSIILDQATHKVLRCPSGESHQKRVSADWILSHRDRGSLKHVIEYEGIGDRTLFNIVSFPAGDRCRLDQLRAFCLILSMIEEKRSRFLLPKCSGRPRYFPTPPSFSIPRVSFAICFKAAGVLLEKVTVDLSALID